MHSCLSPADFLYPQTVWGGGGPNEAVMPLTFRLGLPGSTKANQGHGPQILPRANLIHTTPTVDCAKVIMKLAHLRAFVGTHTHTHPLYTLLPTHARTCFWSQGTAELSWHDGISFYSWQNVCVSPEIRTRYPRGWRTRLKDCALFRSSPYKNG